MDIEDKDDKEAPAEDSFFADDYDEEPIDYDLNADKFLEEDIFEPDLTKNWDKTDLEEELPFDDELEFEDEDDFDHAPEPAPEDDPRYEFEHEEEWQDDDLDSQDDGYSQPWPWGLIAAGIIALLLLAAGGYGVLEQRLETQKEVRLLRAKLATTTSNTEVAESRQAQRNLQIHNEELQTQVEALQAEVAALREALRQKASEPPMQPTETVDPIPAPAPTPKTVKPAVVQEPTTKAAPPEPPIVADTWFVNFGSYKSRATADSWASRLSVSSGRVAVVSGEKKGALYYRVRVLDLPSKEIAGKIARQLEQTHHLSPRWVGKQ